MLISGAAAAVSLAVPGAAAAIPAPIHIAHTDGQGVYIRPSADTSRPAVGWMPEGASPDYNCYVWGQVVNGVPIWFNVNYNGKTGFYASAFDDSSYHSDAELQAKYGIPICGQPAPQPPSTPAPSTPAPSAPAPSTPAPTASTAPSSGGGGGGGGGLVFTVFNANGGIYYRNSPRWADTPQTPGVGVYNGDRVQLICGAAGEAVGPYGNTWWSYVTNLTRPGVGNGWVSEHYINDGAPSGQGPAGEPTCDGSVPGSAAASPPASSQPASPSPNAFFNRQAAVNWALAHARDGQFQLAMCTWFVSHALWAGGFAQEPGAWAAQGGYYGGTRAEWLVPDFLSYIRGHFSTTWIDITSNLRTNAVPQAQPGDVIAYDWGDGEGVSHLTLVVGKAAGDYPEVAEMGQYDFGPVHSILNRINPVNSPYVKRGWTWSAVRSEWLQKKYPRMRAYLLHFN
jgi:hypothetical protein